jgi:hypothetical protein
MRPTMYLLILLLLSSCSTENCCDEIAKLNSEINQLKSEKSYNGSIPEAPKFKEANWRVFDIEKSTPGCFIKEQLDTAFILNYPDWEANFTYIQFQDDEGIRFFAEIENGNASNYHNSFLPHILIPGQKVEVQFESCGSGNFLNILEISNLVRENITSDI